MLSFDFGRVPLRTTPPLVQPVQNPAAYFATARLALDSLVA